jgi:CDP-diacylglycerol--serine O-phosphatidyltransferase
VSAKAARIACCARVRHGFGFCASTTPTDALAKPSAVAVITSVPGTSPAATVAWVEVSPARTTAPLTVTRPDAVVRDTTRPVGGAGSLSVIVSSPMSLVIMFSGSGVRTIVPSAAASAGTKAISTAASPARGTLQDVPAEALIVIMADLPVRYGITRPCRDKREAAGRRSDFFRSGRGTARTTANMSLMPRHFSMIRDFHLADFLTLANGGSGTAALFFAMDHVRESGVGKLYAAGALIVAALVFDVMDGRVARWRHRASPLGREMDSLADVISFGVAPAGLAFAAGMTGLWDALGLVYFVTCGISRLARYNVTAEALSAETGKVTYFEGTPIPTSVLLVVLLVVLAWQGRTGLAMLGGVWTIAGLDLHPLVLLFVLSGSLMISKTLHVPKP